MGEGDSKKREVTGERTERILSFFKKSQHLIFICPHRNFLCAVILQLFHERALDMR